MQTEQAMQNSAKGSRGTSSPSYRSTRRILIIRYSSERHVRPVKSQSISSQQWLFDAYF